MKKATVKIKGRGLYTQSRCHETPKLNKENSDDYEKRTWIEKAHWDEQGRMLIPGLAFKNAIAQIAKHVGEKVPGGGKATYTKHFEAGVTVFSDCLILMQGQPILKDGDEVVGDRLHVPSNGQRGSGSRVFKIFPTVRPGWETIVEFLIYDDVITEEVFLRHLQQAGQLIGVGSFRVRQNGMRGQFSVAEFNWIEDYKFEDELQVA